MWGDINGDTNNITISNVIMDRGGADAVYIVGTNTSSNTVANQTGITVDHVRGTFGTQQIGYGVQLGNGGGTANEQWPGHSYQSGFKLRDIGIIPTNPNAPGNANACSCQIIVQSADIADLEIDGVYQGPGCPNGNASVPLQWPVMQFQGNGPACTLRIRNVKVAAPCQYIDVIQFYSGAWAFLDFEGFTCGTEGGTVSNINLVSVFSGSGGPSNAVLTDIWFTGSDLTSNIFNCAPPSADTWVTGSLVIEDYILHGFNALVNCNVTPLRGGVPTPRIALSNGRSDYSNYGVKTPQSMTVAVRNTVYAGAGGAPFTYNFGSSSSVVRVIVSPDCIFNSCTNLIDPIGGSGVCSQTGIADQLLPSVAAAPQDQSVLTPHRNDQIVNSTATGTVPADLVIYDGTRWRSLDTPASLKSNTVTLVAGSSGSIANTAITANSIVRISNVSGSGVVGAQWVMPSAGVGFTINSTSATDTSKVFWEIVQY
jgi:hypothetical protein